MNATRADISTVAAAEISPSSTLGGGLRQAEAIIDEAGAS